MLKHKCVAEGKEMPIHLLARESRALLRSAVEKDVAEFSWELRSMIDDEVTLILKAHEHKSGQDHQSSKVENASKPQQKVRHKRVTPPKFLRPGKVSGEEKENILQFFHENIQRRKFINKKLARSYIEESKSKLEWEQVQVVVNKRIAGMRIKENKKIKNEQQGRGLYSVMS